MGKNIANWLSNISIDTWQDILVAICAAIVGGIITFLAKWGLKRREGNINLLSDIAKKRIEAIEGLLQLMNELDRSMIINDDECISMLKSLHPISMAFSPIMARVTFYTYEKYLEFTRKLEIFVNSAAILYLDTKILKEIFCLIAYLNVIKVQVGSIQRKMQQDEYSEEEMLNFTDMMVFEISIMTHSEINTMINNVITQLQKGVYNISISKYRNVKKNKAVIFNRVKRSLQRKYRIVYMVEGLYTDRIEMMNKVDIQKQFGVVNNLLKHELTDKNKE